MVAQWACANMLHLATHWPAAANTKYWPQAINYAVWVFNRLPNLTSGILPNELWSRVQRVDNEISSAHVFGCFVYVLDALLQDGKKIPKWNHRARLGLFLGFSDIFLHNSMSFLTINLKLSTPWQSINLLIGNELISFGWAVHVSLIWIMMQMAYQYFLRCWT